MDGIPVLSLILFVPFVAAWITMFLPKNCYYPPRVIPAIAGSINLILSIYLLLEYDAQKGGFQFVEFIPLVPEVGINYYLAVDGISISLVLLTAFILFTGVFASWTILERTKEFYTLLLFLVTGVFGVFVSLDLFLFFLFYELAVLPMYLLIGVWGSSKYIKPRGIFGRMIKEVGVGTKEYAAMKLTLYLLFGSAFILVGIFLLYFLTGANTFNYLVLKTLGVEPGLQKVLFPLIYVGFGVLAGIFPLHTWSPDGHASAPTAASMMHAGVLMKLGAYGVLRVGFELMPEGATHWAWLVGTIATVNIVYGALSAMWQLDTKYIVAYSSVSHMGIVMLGMATLTDSGLKGSVFQMFSHGIMTGLLFALVGLLYEKTHTRDVLEMGGLGRKMPGIATFFTIGGLTSLGLPGLSGFVAEFLVFLGSFQAKFWYWLVPAVLGAFLTAVYVLRILKLVFWGKMDEEKYKDLPDAIGTEWVALIVLGGTLIFFGIFPFVLIKPMEPNILEILQRIKGGIPG